MAKRLFFTIKKTKNIQYSNQQLVAWANDIRMLNEVNQVSIPRINKALDWYEKNIGGSFIPVVESGRALRDKFLRIEEAMNRDKIAFTAPCSSSKYIENDYGRKFYFDPKDGKYKDKSGEVYIV